MRYSTEPANPSSESLQAIDASIALLHADDAVLQSWHEEYAAAHRQRLAFDLEYVLQHVQKTQRILDVGCMPPILLLALQREGYEIQGVDIAPDRFAGSIEEQSLVIERCDIEMDRLPFEDDTFDVVVFNELFEHLRINPLSTMREVHRVMKHESTLFLSTPNLRSCQGVSRLIFKGEAAASGAMPLASFEKLEKLGHMGHVREYTFDEVISVLQPLGFEILERRARGRSRHVFHRFLCAFAPQWKPFMTIRAKTHKKSV